MQRNRASSAPNRLDRPRGDETDALVRAFLIADVRGYTSFTHARGDEPAAQLAATFAARAREAVAATGGEVVELRGDEALCVFPSARQALRAAVAMQVRFRDRVDHEAAFPLGVGIGVAAGEAVRVEGGYRGGALNLAARLCSLATGGQILASDTVTSLAGTLEGVRFVERRRAKVKGFDKPVRVIEVIPDVELPSVPEPVRPRTRARRLLMPAAVAVAVAAIAAVALLLTRHGGGAEPVSATVVPDSLAVVNPRTGKAVAQIHIPGRPSLVVGGRRFVWVASDATRTVSSIAPDRLAVTHVVAAGATPTALAVDGNAVWVLDGNRRVLLKIEPGYDEPTRRIALPPAPPLPATNQRLSSLSVSFGAGALWVTDGSNHLFRVDPASGRVTTLDVHQPLDDVVVERHAIWAISGPAASLFKIDTRDRTVESRIRVVNRLGATAPYPVAVTAGEGFVWVVNANTQTVSKIDPQFDNVAATISLGIGRNPSDIATGAGAVWVANGGNGTLARIDPSTNAATTIPLGNDPTNVAVAGNRVWVSVQPGFRALPSIAVENAAGVQTQTLPASSCSPVEFQGQGQPRFLIASDLPFQGESSLAETLQMSDAVRFVLARHHFRAGPYSIGYQSCDDSIASTGSYDTGRCRANAQAFAATKNVIGLVAGYNSGCVKAELPVVARAPGGPLVLVGSASTYVGLTHAGPGSAAGEPEKYQPGGRRSFVRVVVADDLQGAADAMLAKRLGVTRLYVLHDRDLYGFGIASSVRHGARKLGVRVVGFEGWDPHAPTYEALARRVARAKPDGVFLGGSVDISNGPAVVKDLRAVLGQRVRILLPDGFSPLAAFAHLAGPAAEGIAMSLPAPAPQRLRGNGRQFVADFGKALGRPVEFYSVAAAQATEILLEAIARSDGTRASVTKEVFKTKVRNGVLGSFSFDRNGDTTAGSVTIYQVIGGKPKLVGLITPSPALAR
ncbi:MAG TPA: ABC transporter substrate-binding protein [Gaiellaceae bacterium]|jgi:branched-chain amino acid transport system substrate-binding protein